MQHIIPAQQFCRFRLMLPLLNLSTHVDLGVLTQALEQYPGVAFAYANCHTEMIYVIYMPTQITPQQIVALLEQTGFQVGTPTPR